MALHGDLETFPLPDVLRLLSSTAKTGRLEIDGGDEHGELWFAGGQLTGGRVSTDLNASGSVDVVYELQRLSGASFEFLAEDEADGGEEPNHVDHVLGLAEAMLDEWRAVAAVVPSLDVWASLVPEIEHHEVLIDAERWRTIAGLRGGMSVRELADRFALTELAACRAVKDVVEMGLVAVGEELPAAPPVPELAAEPESFEPESFEPEPAFQSDSDFAFESELGSAQEPAFLAQDELPAPVAEPRDASDYFGDQVGPEPEPAYGGTLEAVDHELPGHAPEPHDESPVSARDRLDAMAATYLSGGAAGTPSDDHTLLPEPLPGAGMSYGASYEDASSFGGVDSYGGDEHAAEAPAETPAPADTFGLDPTAPPIASVPDAGFGWHPERPERPERRTKAPDAVQSALANLSPAAAQAIAEVADRSGQGGRPGTADSDADSVDRGTLLKFLSSVKT
ncbi:MAG: hypothetical protein JWM05_2790 [Acidimicrobiales bacterium]|nr:hypothetical protein [Acidimicrobiales bacterium]